MYELDCSGVIPGCRRVIRAESEAEVIRRAIVQARQFGLEHISPAMLDAMRTRTREESNIRRSTIAA
tara:strand:+ start:493 stop:693 length:201 start_codon:yes stop_codon:yes gene_type:complete